MYRTFSQTQTSSAELPPVVVELCCQSPSTLSLAQKRSLVLHSNGQPVFVKRASRNGSKLVATPYNAYFDCQVMSRNHAELSCVKNGPVMIKDTSRHGTFINDKKIGLGQQMEIKSGDVVRFGDSVTKTSACPDGKVEGIVTIVTFDIKQLPTLPNIPPPPRRGWNVSMPWSDDEVTPDDDEDDDASDKLRHSGFSSLDPIDLDDEEDTQSENDIIQEGPTQPDTDFKAKEHVTVRSLDLENSDDEIAISSDFSGDPLSDNEDDHELDSNFDVEDNDDDDDDDLNDFLPNVEQEDDEDEAFDKLDSPSLAPEAATSKAHSEASPELGDSSLGQAHMPLSGLTQKDNSAVTLKDTFKYRLSGSSKQTQTQTLAGPTDIPAAVCPVSILPPIRATGSKSSAPLSGILAPLAEPRTNPKSGNSVKLLEDLLNPEPQKSVPVWYKPMLEESALVDQALSDSFFWSQRYKAHDTGLSPDISGEHSRNVFADSRSPRAPVHAHIGAGAQAWTEPAVTAPHPTSHDIATLTPVTEIVKEIVLHEKAASVNPGEAKSSNEAEKTNEAEQPEQMASQKVNEDESLSNLTADETTKDQANSLKRKHADDDSELALLADLKPAHRRSVQDRDRRRVVQDFCALRSVPRSVPRPAKRARTSSTSLALTAVAGAVGGAVATLSFLLSPLAERLLESAA